VQNWNLADGVIIQVPVLLQTLVSPLKVGAALPDEKRARLNKKIKVAEELCQGSVQIEVEVTVNGQAEIRRVTVEPVAISTNHPINIFGEGFLKAALDTDAAFNQEQEEKFVTVVTDFIDHTAPFVMAQVKKECEADSSRRVQDNPRVQALTEISENLVAYNSIRGASNNGRGQQLFLASMEQIITQQIGGIAHSSCKSGKDRKGIELLHTDAMLAYKEKYGQLPKYDAKEVQRERFCDVMAEMFLKNHQQATAMQNTPGCHGLKSTTQIVPDDMQATIRAKIKEHNSQYPEAKLPDPFEANENNSQLNKPLGKALSITTKINLELQQKKADAKSKGKEHKIGHRVSTSKFATGALIAGGAIIAGLVLAATGNLGAGLLTLLGGVGIGVGGMIYGTFHALRKGEEKAVKRMSSLGHIGRSLKVDPDAIKSAEHHAQRSKSEMVQSGSSVAAENLEAGRAKHKSAPALGRAEAIRQSAHFIPPPADKGQPARSKIESTSAATPAAKDTKTSAQSKGVLESPSTGSSGDKTPSSQKLKEKAVKVIRTGFIEKYRPSSEVEPDNKNGPTPPAA